LGLHPAPPQGNQKSHAAPVKQNHVLPEDEKKYQFNSSVRPQPMNLQAVSLMSVVMIIQSRTPPVMNTVPTKCGGFFEKQLIFLTRILSPVR